MKKSLMVFALLISGNIFAKTCAEFKPWPRYFDMDYIRENIFAPNWDDLCYEVNSNEENKRCIEEANMWAKWSKCDQSREVKRKLSCFVESIGTSSDDIGSVDLEIYNGGMRILYTYRGSSNLFEDEFNHGDGTGLYSYSKNQLIFGYDGEHSGKLASFDNGKTFSGKAYISQDFTTFLECN